MYMDSYKNEQSQSHNRMEIKKELSIFHNDKNLRMLTTCKEHDKQHESVWLHITESGTKDIDPKCKLGNKAINIRDDSIKTDSVWI